MLKTQSKTLTKIALVMCLIAIFACVALPQLSTTSVYAEDTTAADTTTSETEQTADNTKGSKAISAAIVVGLAAALGAFAMGMAISKSNEAIARQPEASSQIRSGLMLGLVFIETAIIYALIVAILIIFVL